MELKSNSVMDVSPISAPSTEGTSKQKRAPHKRNLQKRVLHAVGNGLRTSESIANALNVNAKAVGTALYSLSKKGGVIALKKTGSNQLKYYLTTEKPMLDGVNIDAPHKSKKRKTYKARVAKVVTVVKNEMTAEQAKTVVQMQVDIDRYIQRISQLEHSLTEKEKEVWTLECDVFDKKAVIKYLEEKLFQLGVRV